jgi:hypothetical protein
LTVTGDGSLRRLRFHILRRCRSATLRVAPSFRVDCRASDASFRFPFVSHLPALPANDPRCDSRVVSFGGADWPFPGCPVQRSFGIADDQVPSCPGTCIFRRQLMNLPESPRFVHPPASPERIYGSPRIFFGLWLLRLTGRHFAMALRSFEGADGLSSGSPRIPVPRLLRPRFLESPRFHSVGWVDDEPWLSSNFASPDCAVDESSRPIRFRSLCLTLDALSISSALDYRLAPTA